MSGNIKEKPVNIILNEMIDVVENSRNEMFHSSEEARLEYEELERELKATKISIIQHIEKGGKLEQNVNYSKRRLSEVSRYFDEYSEEEIRRTYETIHEMQTKLIIVRQEEKRLKEKRDDLEKRLISLEYSIKQAEGLANKISVILTYLSNDFKQVNELLNEAKEKQQFSLKIIETQEEERKRISREIHDGPAQMLANILLRTEIVDHTCREGSQEEVLQEIKALRTMVRTSLYEVRRIIYDLRPMALDDLGLIPTIRKYVANTEEYNNVTIEFTAIGDEERINQQHEVALFRLTQEALQNAIKHANASVIKVHINITSEQVTLEVKDNGVGFDTTVKRDKSFGIMGMRERVEMFKGKIKIESKIGQGTSVFITVPKENLI